MRDVLVACHHHFESRLLGGSQQLAIGQPGPAHFRDSGNGKAGQLVAHSKTIKGFEVMRALRKGQVAIFNITRDIRGEACLVERAFGLGASALAEAVRLVSEQLALEAA